MCRAARNQLWALASIVLFFLASASVAAQPEVAANVHFAAGVVTAQSGDAPKRPLAKGSDVLSRDRVETGADGRVQMRFTDGSLVSLMPGTSFLVEEYRLGSGGADEGSLVFNMVRGGLRTVTGSIGSTRKENYQLKTPVGTLGIRGTEFIAVLNTPTTLHVHVGRGGVVLRNEHGAIDVPAGGSAKMEQGSAPQATDEPPVFAAAGPAAEEEEEASDDGADDSTASSGGRSTSQRAGVASAAQAGGGAHGRTGRDVGTAADVELPVPQTQQLAAAAEEGVTAPDQEPKPEPGMQPEPAPEPAPTPAPQPEPAPQPQPQPQPEPQPGPAPQQEPDVTPPVGGGDTGGADPGEPGIPREPADPVDPLDPVDPDPVNPDPVDPDPVDPDPVDPDPVDPDPVDPDPVDPDPVDPDPVDPDPVDPDPVDPDPVDPDPVDPDPVDPDPVDPVNPVDPLPELDIYPAKGVDYRLSYIRSDGTFEILNGQGLAEFDTQSGALLAYEFGVGQELKFADPSAPPELVWPDFNGEKGNLTIGLMSLDAGGEATLPYVAGKGWIPDSASVLSYSLSKQISGVGAEMKLFNLQLELGGQSPKFDLDMELTHDGVDYTLDLPEKRNLWMNGDIIRLHSSDLKQHLDKGGEKCLGCEFDASGMLGNEGANAGFVYSLEDGAKNIHGAVMLNNTNP